jgi:hypothetical protein
LSIHPHTDIVRLSVRIVQGELPRREQCTRQELAPDPFTSGLIPVDAARDEMPREKDNPISTDTAARTNTTVISATPLHPTTHVTPASATHHISKNPADELGKP